MLKCPNLCEGGREQCYFPLSLRNVISLPSFLIVTQSEGRVHIPAVYNEQETIPYAELADAAKRVGNAMLNVGVELENRVMICPARRAVKFKGVSCGGIRNTLA